MGAAEVLAGRRRREDRAASVNGAGRRCLWRRRKMCRRQRRQHVSDRNQRPRPTWAGRSYHYHAEENAEMAKIVPALAWKGYTPASRRNVTRIYAALCRESMSAPAGGEPARRGLNKKSWHVLRPAT